MNSQLFTQLVIGIILVVGALISAYILPPLKDWIVSKIGAQKMADFVSFVEKCVKWANQTIPAEFWEKKKEEVVALVKDYISKHEGLELTDEEIDAIIEAIVYSVKHKD